METTKTLDCEQAGDLIRRAALEQLQIDVRRHEDMFLPWVGCGEAELNQYAIAEWAWNLLERQREAITEAVMRALDEAGRRPTHDNDEETK